MEAPAGRTHPLSVRAHRIDGAPVVAVRVWLTGGGRVEPIPGQTLVTGRLLIEGSRRRSWLQIVCEAEDRGMAVGGFGGFEGHGLAIEALAVDWERALEWAAELVREPVFPQDRFDWAVRQVAAELKSLADQPEVVTAWRFLDQLYRPHPRSRPLHGRKETLERLTRRDCAAFHRAAVDCGVLVTVAGEIDEALVAKRIEELFAGVGGGTRALAEPPAPVGSATVQQTIASGGTDQAHLYLGHLTVPRLHDDHPALGLLGVVLGSGPGITGRIPMRIREKEGLAYSAHAETVAGAGLDPGRLVIYLGTSPESVECALQAAREELDRLLAEGVSTKEMEMARGYQLGREPFLRETARQWADILVEAEVTGLPVDSPDWLAESLQDLDRGDLDRVAREHLRPERLRATIGLPQSR